MAARSCGALAEVPQRGRRRVARSPGCSQIWSRRSWSGCRLRCRDPWWSQSCRQRLLRNQRRSGVVPLRCYWCHFVGHALEGLRLLFKSLQVPRRHVFLCCDGVRDGQHRVRLGRTDPEIDTRALCVLFRRRRRGRLYMARLSPDSRGEARDSGGRIAAVHRRGSGRPFLARDLLGLGRLYDVVHSDRDAGCGHRARVRHRGGGGHEQALGDPRLRAGDPHCALRRLGHAAPEAVRGRPGALAHRRPALRGGRRLHGHHRRRVLRGHVRQLEALAAAPCDTTAAERGEQHIVG
mmetsp:Transcript_57720/g.160888  ORF Transcript_57720/g.160888 Transcript_57720/m.160888 type:complete len:293 (+) Transcript_57720:182-1060(+)